MIDKAPKPERSYALLIIALCFLASAALRSGSVAEAASVSFQAARTSAESTQVSEKPKEKFDSQHESSDCNASALIAMLKSREAEFLERETNLNTRAAKLDAVTKRLEERLASLETAREALEKTVANVDGAQSRDIEHLVVMYSTMKPKTAGKLFDQMDVKFASELLVRTKPEIASLILANMSPDKAFTASVMIARRNAGAPSE